MRSVDLTWWGYAEEGRRLPGVILSTCKDQRKVVGEFQGPLLAKGFIVSTVVSEQVWDKSRKAPG